MTEFEYKLLQELRTTNNVLKELTIVLTTFSSMWVEESSNTCKDMAAGEYKRVSEWVHNVVAKGQNVDD